MALYASIAPPKHRDHRDTEKTASVFSVPRWCGLTHNCRAGPNPAVCRCYLCISVLSVPLWCGLTHNGRTACKLCFASLLSLYLCALCVSVVWVNAQRSCRPPILLRLFAISVLSVSLWCGSYTKIAPVQSCFASFLSLCSLCLCGFVLYLCALCVSVVLFCISVLSVSLW